MPKLSAPFARLRLCGGAPPPAEPAQQECGPASAPEARRQRPGRASRATPSAEGQALSSDLPAPRRGRPSPRWAEAGLPEGLFKLDDKRTCRLNAGGPNPLLGRGAFGEVELAWDAAHRRYVAVKRLRLLDDPRERARALREMHILASLHHPCIPALQAAGFVRSARQPGLKAYLVMGLVQGSPLSRAERPSLSRAEAFQFIDILAYVHAQGIAHGDLNVDNLMLGARGCALIDFGCAALDAAPRAMTLDWHRLDGLLRELLPKQTPLLRARMRAHGADLRELPYSLLTTHTEHELPTAPLSGVRPPQGIRPLLRFRGATTPN